jgi:P27 family predicted phage terminase small subunit
MAGEGEPMSGTPGQSGRKPLPTSLKLLRGNPGKRPLNHNEPKPTTRLPRAPDHLSVEAKKEWRRAGRFLLTLGLISDLDLAAFAAYCTAYGRWVEAEDALKTYGVMIKSPNGFPVQSPYLGVANKAMEQMRSLLSEFGMSPASRTRVAGVAQLPEEEDEFMALFER